LDSKRRFDTAAASLAVRTHSHLWTRDVRSVKYPMKLNREMTFNARQRGNLFTGKGPQILFGTSEIRLLEGRIILGRNVNPNLMKIIFIEQVIRSLRNRLRSE
jgi:hypothetical protein